MIKYPEKHILIMQDMVKWGAGVWIDRLADWQTYFTMTFDLVKLQCNWGDGTWTRVGMGYAKNAWKHFVKYNSVGDWCMVVEKQRYTKNAHIHALTTGNIDSSVLGVVGEKWGYCHAVPYNRELGASFYIAKYLTKGYDTEVTFSCGVRTPEAVKAEVDCMVQAELIRRINACRR